MAPIIIIVLLFINNINDIPEDLSHIHEVSRDFPEAPSDFPEALSDFPEAQSAFP